MRRERLKITIEIPDQELERALAPLLGGTAPAPAAEVPDRIGALKLRQVAERLGASYSSVYEAVNRGDLKAMRIGGRAIRVTEQALADFIREREEDFAPLREPAPLPPPPVSRRVVRPVRQPPPPPVEKPARQRRPRPPSAAERRRMRDDLLSPAELAKQIAVSEEGAEALYREGKFPVTEGEDGLVKARRGDVIDWMEREQADWRAWLDKYDLRYGTARHRKENV